MELIILIGTLAAVFLAAIWGRSAASQSEYWINNRETPWWLLAVTVSSSTVGAGTIFGTATIAYFGGNLGAIIGVCYAFGIITFGLLIAPRICHAAREHGRYSLGDFIAATTSPVVAKLSAAIFSIAYLFNTAAQFAAMSYIIGFLADIDYVTALGLSGLCILAYTSIGGIRADMRTDMIQLALFALAIPLLYGTMARSNPDVWTDYFALPTEMLTGTAARGTVFLLAAALLFPLSVIASVDLWQRSFAASSPRVAKLGFVAGGVIMICLFVSFSLLGTFAFLTAPSLDPNTAILHFTQAAATPVVLGLLISGLFAGILSTVDTMALATALSVSKDLFGWQEFRRQRFTVASTILIALATALVIPDVINLVVNAMSALLVLLPVLLGVFFLGGAMPARLVSQSSLVALLCLPFSLLIRCGPLCPEPSRRSGPFCFARRLQTLERRGRRRCETVVSSLQKDAPDVVGRLTRSLVAPATKRREANLARSDQVYHRAVALGVPGLASQ